MRPPSASTGLATNSVGELRRRSKCTRAQPPRLPVRHSKSFLSRQQQRPQCCAVNCQAAHSAAAEAPCRPREGPCTNAGAELSPIQGRAESHAAQRAVNSGPAAGRLPFPQRPGRLQRLRTWGRAQHATRLGSSPGAGQFPWAGVLRPAAELHTATSRSSPAWPRCRWAAATRARWLPPA